MTLYGRGAEETEASSFCTCVTAIEIDDCGNFGGWAAATTGAESSFLEEEEEDWAGHSFPMVEGTFPKEEDMLGGGSI